MSSTPNNRQFANVQTIRVQANISGTTPFTIWTPASGNIIVFRGCALRAWVQTALVGATAGDAVQVVVGTQPYVVLGAIRTATDAAGTDYGFTYVDCGDPGFRSTSLNPLRILTGNTIGTGVINISGLIWGDEILA